MTRDLMIGELKKVKPSYNYDRYDDKQLFRMYQKYVLDKTPKGDMVTHQTIPVPTNVEKSIEEYEKEYENQVGYKTCDICGTRLNDGGTCPRCDDGNEDLEEALYNPDHNYIAKETSYEIAAEIAQCAKRALKLPIHEVEMLEHDINNLRADEWVDMFAELPDTSKAKQLFFQYAITYENPEENLKEGIRIDNDNEPFEIGSRVAERWNDGFFNVGTIIDIKQNEEGLKYQVKWDYSDRDNIEWLFYDEITHWIDDMEENFDIDDEYTDTVTEDKACVICGDIIERYGNNAAPIADGICCDRCNREKVIPARLRKYFDASLTEGKKNNQVPGQLSMQELEVKPEIERESSGNPSRKVTHGVEYKGYIICAGVHNPHTFYIKDGNNKFVGTRSGYSSETEAIQWIDSQTNK